MAQPAEDLPIDFEERRIEHYGALRKPLDPTEFIDELQQEMRTELEALHAALPECSWLDIAERRQGPIKLTPLPPVAEPRNLRKLKNEVQTRWGAVPLIDILKETVLRTGCLRTVTSVADRGTLPENVLAERLLLAIYAYGTNTGVRAVAAGAHGHGEDEIRYARRRYLSAEASGGLRSRSPTQLSPPAARRSGVSPRPPSPAIRRISGRSIRTSSPSSTPVTAAAGCSSTGAWRRTRWLSIPN